LIEDRIHIDGIPQNDHVHYQTECAQLIFLSLAISLMEFAAFAMKNVTRQAVSALAQIESLKRASPARLIVDKLNVHKVPFLEVLPLHLAGFTTTSERRIQAATALHNLKGVI
jgi:hypothetical protein